MQTKHSSDTTTFLIRMAKIPTLLGMWSNRNSYSLLVAMQNATATLVNNSQYHTKLSQFLPYDPAIVRLGIYPRYENLCAHKNLYECLQQLYS